MSEEEVEKFRSLAEEAKERYGDTQYAVMKVFEDYVKWRAEEKHSDHPEEEIDDIIKLFEDYAPEFFGKSTVRRFLPMVKRAWGMMKREIIPRMEEVEREKTRKQPGLI